MRKYIITILIGSVIICFSVACGGSQPATTQTQTSTVTEAKPVDTIKIEEVKTEELAGKGTYTTYCAVCHQADGKGVPNMNPSLVNKDWVGGDKTKLIKVVLNGLNEPITVNGEQYEGVMASHDFLTDKQIADVLSYVRKSFGNDYEVVTEAEVADVRKNNKK
jgi:mono/diheme cytochrome c family protein